MHTIFGAKDSVGAGQEAARAVIVFLAGWGMIRLFGRRAFGRWSALDIVVAIVVGSNLSRTLTGSAPLGGTLLATTVASLVVSRKRSRDAADVGPSRQ